ncbi:hypothetical protein E3N88_41930 [Mikania micrantha]|uniref:Uncharacterized protein n=1 Tax=Mikania micrantha TaxID=192012 RepID=A0A5N6LJG0_9ASTR|nr:hypothetical protein E3N88_41930 [Mikania micrantha]
MDGINETTKNSRHNLDQGDRKGLAESDWKDQRSFEVTFEGTMCIITKPYMVCVEHKVKEDAKASKEYVTEERKSNIKWNDDNGKGKEIEPNIETGRITTLEEMEIFLDLLGSININRLNKWTLRKKLEDMVICVQFNGGKGNVNDNNFWVLLAADMVLDSRKGYKLMFIYNEYLDLMEWLYKNMKSRKKQQGVYTFGEGKAAPRAPIKKKQD